MVDSLSDRQSIAPSPASGTRDVLRTIRTRDDSIEASLKSAVTGMHLGTVDMVAQRDYSLGNAPHVATVITAYRYISRRMGYSIHNEKINKV
jgi:hypothetical protein